MNLVVLRSEREAAWRAAEFIAERARASIAERGRFHLALSGGSTPELMLEDLSGQELDWRRIELFQVDERLAKAGDSSRNAEQLRRALLSRVEIPARNIHLMPVESENPKDAAARYAATLEAALWESGRLDLVHLGLGSDGHTASLIPGDPLVAEAEEQVGISQVYQGRKRMTLLRAPLNRARERVFLVTGESKRRALELLRAGDRRIPASSIESRETTVFADEAALRPE